jgi:hypothetical protein
MLARIASHDDRQRGVDYPDAALCRRTRDLGRGRKADVPTVGRGHEFIGLLPRDAEGRAMERFRHHPARDLNAWRADARRERQVPIDSTIVRWPPGRGSGSKCERYPDRSQEGKSKSNSDESTSTSCSHNRMVVLRSSRVLPTDHSSRRRTGTAGPGLAGVPGHGGRPRVPSTGTTPGSPCSRRWRIGS